MFALSLREESFRSMEPNVTNTNELNLQTALAAWTPIENTYYHFLTFDLGEKRTVKSIATLGRSHTNEFVTEYIVQYSDDGEIWRSYISPGGEEKVKLVCSMCLSLLLSVCVCIIKYFILLTWKIWLFIGCVFMYLWLMSLCFIKM